MIISYLFIGFIVLIFVCIKIDIYLCNKSKPISDLSPFLKSQGKKIWKPWGYEVLWAHTTKYAGKILCIQPNQELSVQYHKKKSESMRVLSGKGNLKLGILKSKTFTWKTEQDLYPGDCIFIRPKTVHVLRAYGPENLEILEVSTPELDDVVRLSDNYGRV